MAEKFSRSVLRIVAAQLSQAVGFNSIHSSSLDILTNVFERYLLVLGNTVHDFSEKCGQTQAHLSDVEFALHQLHVSLPDMVEYMQQMEPVVFPQTVPKFPMPKSSNLQFPSGNNPEDFDREEHIPLYMPSMAKATTQMLENNETESVTASSGQQGKSATFVIAGKQDSSSDEDDYSAADISNDEYVSDDSLAHNPSKSRHLTKPEDIPMIEGTAPSSMMSIPSSTELDELRGSMSPNRRMNFESIEDYTEGGLKKGKKSLGQVDKYNPARRLSQTSDDLPWLPPEKSGLNKWHASTPESSNRKGSWMSPPTKSNNEEPKWLSKKMHDKYDADWLQNEPASPVHLTKPPTPDGSFESPTAEKQSWYEDSRSPGGPDIGLPGKKSKDSVGLKLKTGAKSSTASPYSNQKSNLKHYSDRKPSHHKHYKSTYKNSPSGKRTEITDEPIKARIEAAEKLIHAPPVPYRPSSPKTVKRKPSSQQASDSPVRSSIERAEKLLKHPPVENLSFSSREASPAPNRPEKATEKIKDDKSDRLSNFASSKSMYDAIDAVINRASEKVVKEDEQARREAEEAELMKFTHLIEDSSSSDSEPDVSDKAEQMLQLEERGLREARPPTPGISPPHPNTPSSTETPQSYVIDDDEEDVIIDSEDDISDVTPAPPVKKSLTPDHHRETLTPKLKFDKHKKEKHKKKSRKSSHDENASKVHKSHSVSKVKKDKHSPKSSSSSFVTTETISEKPVKMKVKLKPNFLEHNEPKLFDVDKDRDRIWTTEGKHSSKLGKEGRHKSKEGKHHKSKDHKRHQSSKSVDFKESSVEHDQSVEKIILKKSKSGDAKVVKPKITESKRSPSPPSPVVSRSLPLPKLSAAVPVLNVTPLSKEKEKKKSKKEKKKKKDREKERSHEKEKLHDKERHHDKQRSDNKEKMYEREKSREERPISRKESKDSDVSSPTVPKLTLKMRASEKKFVIKQSGSNGKSSGKKRSHSFVADSPIPAKERKVSVESIKATPEAFPTAVERKVITQTISAGPVGVYEDEQGNKIWICPGCNKPDDGSPMIGCDTCDDWYHWPCVNITREPPDDQDWYCPRCLKRQQQGMKGKASGKKRKKK